MEDCIQDGDNVAPRSNLDTVLNKHGETLLEYLKDSKCCILNGRISPEKDHFASISTKGKNVVDNIITPHDCLNTCFEYNGFTPNELSESVGVDCMSLIGDRCRIPDH